MTDPFDFNNLSDLRWLSKKLLKLGILEFEFEIAGFCIVMQFYLLFDGPIIWARSKFFIRDAEPHHASLHGILLGIHHKRLAHVPVN